ncbi:hypothetical protein L3Q82_008590 [Scortum barcoo]|uniref:Uncharacterized protein n=1 Tax=Scortum barcoo TaxID=214431 RepID=A0ACB8XBC2_9TELE|nr:hypothetical protein L3Q82_008590 [Scortum barcoo]
MERDFHHPRFHGRSRGGSKGLSGSVGHPRDFEKPSRNSLSSIDNRLRERERETSARVASLRGSRGRRTPSVSFADRATCLHPSTRVSLAPSCWSRGTYAAGQDQISPGRATEKAQGGRLFLLREIRSPGQLLSSKREGSSGLRRDLVSQIKNNPPRSLTPVTLSIKGKTVPLQALIDSGADESLMDKALASSLGINFEPLHSPVTARSPDSTCDPIPDHSDYPDLSKVPPCYYDLKEVFNKTKATSLPPHREWDCAIELLPGAPIPKARLYSLSGPERKAMEEYITASLGSLGSGIIRPSSSACWGRILLRGPKVFTKLDLRNAYHLVSFLGYVITANHISMDPAKVDAVTNWPPLTSKKKLRRETTNVGNKELLAVKVALEEWRHWLEGAEQPFIVWTDHKNLEYLKSAKRLNSRQARWALFFSRFRFTLLYRPGSQNAKPDVPVPTV